MSGAAGDSEPISCEYRNGWRWEPRSEPAVPERTACQPRVIGDGTLARLLCPLDWANDKHDLDMPERGSLHGQRVAQDGEGVSEFRVLVGGG